MSSEMSALDIFDYCQTIAISAGLAVTIPLACIVYFKLLFSFQFSKNYTFKLIVCNGIAQLLSSIMYLINLQLTTYPFMYKFYASVRRAGLATSLMGFNLILGGFSLHTSLCIALNRMKTLLFFRSKNNDVLFFLMSIFMSIVLLLPIVVDYCFNTEVIYKDFPVGDSLAMFPISQASSEIPRTISNVIRIFVSFATLMANLYLFALITRERKFIDSNDRRKFNGEKGLVITSVVSYSFYMLYFVNNLISRYFAVRFCGYAQWMFVGLASMTPFWCLLLFSPSVRRLLIIRMQDVSATTVQSVTPTAPIL